MVAQVGAGIAATGEREEFGIRDCPRVAWDLGGGFTIVRDELRVGIFRI